MPYFKLPDVFYTTPDEPTHKVKYGKKPFQSITVRVPGGDGPHPTLLTIHGGKWKSSYRAKQMEYLCADLVKHGIASCNLEFKRLGHIDGGYPGTFIDLLDGIDCVLANADEWKLDKAKMSLLGHSSGGHLAVCLCAIDQSEEFADRPLPFTPFSVITIAGALDLKNLEGLKPEIEEFFGKHPVLSPMEQLPVGAKQLVLVGSKDRLMNQCLDYAVAAEKAGDKVSSLVIEKCSHFRVIDPTFSGWSLIREAIVDTATK